MFENRLDNNGWKATVDGLHTQHVQALEVALGLKDSQVVYGTQDNNSWYGNYPNWQQAGPGDTNAIAADAGSPKQAFLFRSFPSYDLVSLDGISQSFSSASTPTSILSDPHQPDRADLIQFIQSVKGETRIPLDAYMVVQRPVEDQQTPPQPIKPPAALSGIEQAGNPWLLRNKSWSSEPDFYRGIANGNWVAELKDLPVGTQRVFASGGHANPHYFASVQGATGLALYERRYQRGQKSASWLMVFNGVIDWTTQCQAWEGWYGPVFVNPYDASKVFLLAPDGVKVSHRDAAENLIFADDSLLTTLSTASNTYPLVRQYCGGNASQVVLAFRVLGTSTLGLVSFFAMIRPRRLSLLLLPACSTTPVTVCGARSPISCPQLRCGRPDLTAAMPTLGLPEGASDVSAMPIARR